MAKNKNRFLQGYTPKDFLNAFKHPLVWYFIALAVVVTFGLCSCTTAPAKYEIVGVTGTRYAAVFKDGAPLAPGSYLVALTGSDTADVLVRGRKVGSGKIRLVSGKPDSIRIEITPGTTQVVVQ